MENKLLRSYFNQEVRIYNLFGFHKAGRMNLYGDFDLLLQNIFIHRNFSK